MSVSAHEIGTSLGYLGATLGVSMVIPQIVRTLRNRKLTGVSAMSWAMSVFSSSGWLLYGLMTHEAVQIPGNILLVSGAIAVVLLVPAPMAAPVRGLLLAVGLSAYALLACVAPSGIVVSIAIAIGVMSTVPQVRQSLTRPAHVRSAVSVSTWTMRVASQGCWLAFAILVHDWTVFTSAIFIETCNITVLVTEARRSAIVHEDVVEGMVVAEPIAATA